MNREQEWKEIEENIKLKNDEIIEKYGFDIRNQKIKIKKNKKDYINLIIKKYIKRIFFIVMIGGILGICIIPFKLMYDKKQSINPNTKEMLENEINEQIELKYEEELQNGKSIYIFQLKSIPEIEIHAVKNWNKLQSDALDRINKYYFEKWEDIEKNKFFISEEYKDISIGEIKKEKWLLKYKTYIEVNNYEELIKATNSIIRFIKFKGENKMPTMNLIKVGDDFILPNHKFPQSINEMQEDSIKEYIQIVKNRKLKIDDIPNEVLNKYWNS